MRQRVNRALCSRPALGADEWFETFYKSQGIAYPIAIFAYVCLGHCSGLEFGRVLPSDRLQEDLHWSQVCWFDWELSMCDGFYQQFGVDISDRLDEFEWSTVGELVAFLDQCAHKPGTEMARDSESRGR